MTHSEHLELAASIWNGRIAKSATSKFEFLADLKLEEFAEWYVACRTNLPSIKEICQYTDNQSK